MNFSTAITLTDITGKSFTFNTVESLEDFIKKEMDFWVSLVGLINTNPTASSFIQKYSTFQQILNQLASWKPNFETWDSNTTYTNVLNLFIPNLGPNWIWTNHPVVHKWLELNQTSTNFIADAFFEAMIQKTTNRFSNGIDFFQGYLIAYEFINQGKTDINKRRNAEVKSFEKLRTELVEKQSELISEVSNFQEEIVDWKSNEEQKLSNLMINKEKCLDDTNVYHSKSFHEQSAIWSNSIAELENKFKEKLRFASPANYWNTSAKKLRQQGYFWVSALILTIISSVVWFSNYFLAWLISGKPTKLGIDSLEGLLIFAAILSSLAFLIKALSRLTFSSFHLMRDAEEREQLTHLYLSLRDGKEDDPEARKIILQSLFSRSESGLLSGEHGPTMPTTTEILNALGKGK